MNESWAEEAKRLDASGDVDAALDVLFNNVDDLILDYAYPFIDVYLDSVDPREYSVTFLIGVLTVTNACKKMLRRRVSFVERCRPVFAERQHRLLEGFI